MGDLQYLSLPAPHGRNAVLIRDGGDDHGDEDEEGDNGEDGDEELLKLKRLANRPKPPRPKATQVPLPARYRSTKVL